MVIFDFWGQALNGVLESMANPIISANYRVEKGPMTSTTPLLFVNLTQNHDKLTFGSRIVDKHAIGKNGNSFFIPFSFRFRSVNVLCCSVGWQIGDKFPTFREKWETVGFVEGRRNIARSGTRRRE